jgi:hypothetical protein
MSGSIPEMLLESGAKISSAGYRIRGSAGATVAPFFAGVAGNALPKGVSRATVPP